MCRYVVRFMKRVVGGNGREVEICQRWVETDAPDKTAAEELAKSRFCKEERVTHWSIHADRVAALEADFPS